MTTEQTDSGKADSPSQNWQVILARSILVGDANMLPLPGIADKLGAALTRGLIYHVAQLRYVDIEEAAVDTLVSPAEKQGRLSILSTLGGLLSLLRRGRMRRLFAGLAVLNGIEEASRSFHIAMLLDHYCSQHHSGVAIRVEEARKLKQAMDEATRSAQRALGGKVLDEVITQGQHFFQKVPAWIWAQIRRTDAMPPLPALQALAHEAKNAVSVLSPPRYFTNVVQNFDQQWSKTAGGS